MQIELVYRKCIHCGQWHSDIVIISYTVFGNRTVWSDGKNDSDDYFGPDFIKCTACKKLFWKEDAPTINDYLLKKYSTLISTVSKYQTHKHPDLKEYNEEHVKFTADCYNLIQDDPDFKFPKAEYPPDEYFEKELEEELIKDILELLKQPLDNYPERELSIRLILWQTINDFYRNSITDYSSIKYVGMKQWFKQFFDQEFHKRQKSIKLEDLRKYNYYKPLLKENLLRIKQLMTKNFDNYEEDLFIYIEIHRELGEFEEAMQLINNYKFEDKPVFITKSKKLIMKKNVDVFIVCDV